jgi:hypothetical protein
MPTITLPASAPAPSVHLAKPKSAALPSSAGQPPVAQEALHHLSAMQAATDAAWQAAQTTVNATFAQLQAAITSRLGVVTKQMEEAYAKETAQLESRKV